MNQFAFQVEMLRADGAPSGGVRERAYGAARVTAQWTDGLPIAVQVEGDVDRRDAPAYVELFFHDVFLLLNLATPGSFAGRIVVTGSDLRVRPLALSSHAFRQATGTVPIETVVAWYDRLDLGARQIATDATSTALFQLLHLARAEEDEEIAIIRLARAAEALLGRPDPLRRLFELRDEIVQGVAPAYHPLHDDALDPQVEDATQEWIEVADAAARAVIAALQAQAVSAAGPASTRRTPAATAAGSPPPASRTDRS